MLRVVNEYPRTVILKWWPSYWEQGMFNVPKIFDTLLTERPITVEVHLEGIKDAVKTILDRGANPNGTARVRDFRIKVWAQDNFDEGDYFRVSLISETKLRLRKASQEFPFLVGDRATPKILKEFFDHEFTDRVYDNGNTILVINQKNRNRKWISQDELWIYDNQYNSLERINKNISTLLHSIEGEKDIKLFTGEDSSRWDAPQRFAGNFRCIGYFITSKNTKHGDNKTIVFRLKPQFIPSKHIDIKPITESERLDLINHNTQESIMASSLKKMTVKEYFPRSLKIKIRALQQADGICQLCHNEGPFLDDQGETFLEIHHIRPLGEGGKDCLSNVIALCPNCHRAAHLSNKRAEIRAALQAKVRLLTAKQ